MDYIPFFIDFHIPWYKSQELKYDIIRLFPIPLQDAYFI